MIARYHLLSERLRAELISLEQVVERAEQALSRAEAQPKDRGFFLAAAALDLHGFYAGLEHLFERISIEVDGDRPTGASWHRDLLAQMALDVSEVRPPVILAATRSALVDYLEFRHVVRNPGERNSEIGDVSGPWARSHANATARAAAFALLCAAIAALHDRPLRLQPRLAVFVASHHHVGGQDRLPDFSLDGVGDGAAHARSDGHGKKGGVQPWTPR